MDEALIVAVLFLLFIINFVLYYLFLFFVVLAVRIFERNYDDMLTSIEEELERQAAENYGFVKDEMTLLHLQMDCLA